MTRDEAVDYMFKEWFYLEEENKIVLRNNIDKIYDDFESERANTVLVPSDKLKAMQKKIAEFKSRTCNTCIHCDKSTLTQLKQAYCNKLQTSISDYDRFYCAYWKE